MKPFALYLETLLPHHLLSEFMGWLASRRWGWLSQAAITWFIKHYEVNMQEALHEDPSDYLSFHDFFTRTLKPDARPIEGHAQQWVSPADGVVSQYGDIEEGKIIQAKGHDYSVLDLLAGHTMIADQYKQGSFATIYLSPKDYHRVHMPIKGMLKKMMYVPGRLFSVKPVTVNHVPHLFARNERVVCQFETDQGHMAVVFVGAMIVGSVHTAWSGQVCPTRLDQVTTTDYMGEAFEVDRGEELGFFTLGSTVIVLTEKRIDQWHVADNGQIKMGDLLAG